MGRLYTKGDLLPPYKYTYTLLCGDDDPMLVMSEEPDWLLQCMQGARKKAWIRARFIFFSVETQLDRGFRQGQLYQMSPKLKNKIVPDSFNSQIRSNREKTHLCGLRKSCIASICLTLLVWDSGDVWYNARWISIQNELLMTVFVIRLLLLTH